MATPTFNLTARAERKDFAIYVNVGTDAAPEWEVQGYGTEEAALEYSPDEESIVDILGIQHNYVNKLERSMSIDPNSIRPIENTGKLNPILHEYTRRGDLQKLSTFQVLLVYWYTTEKAADLYPTCTIIPQSLGGSSRTDFPYDIKLGGEPVFGTAAKAATTGVVTFTAETSTTTP